MEQDKFSKSMLDTFLLIGSNHQKSVYQYVMSKLTNHRPDLVVLEREISFSKLIIGPGYSEKKKLSQIQPGPKKIRRRKIKGTIEERIGLYLNGEKLDVYFPEEESTAGMDYALDNVIPLYFIDTKKGNVIFGLDHDHLIKLQIPYDGPTTRTILDITGRNKFMANAINFLILKYNSNMIAYIGGLNHFDKEKCIPLQNMVKTKRCILINAVSESEQIFYQSDKF